MRSLDREALSEKITVPDGIAYCIANRKEICLSSDPENLNRSRSELPWDTGDGESEFFFSAEDSGSGLEYLILLDLEIFEGESNKEIVFIVLFNFALIWMTIIFFFVISLQLFRPIEPIVESLDTNHIESSMEVPLGENELE